MSKGDSFYNRNAALRGGEKTYMGKPCGHGHLGLRYVTNRVCVSCLRSGDNGRVYDKAKGAAQKRAYRARLKAHDPAALGVDILESL